MQNYPRIINIISDPGLESALAYNWIFFMTEIQDLNKIYMLHGIAVIKTKRQVNCTLRSCCGTKWLLLYHIMLLLSQREHATCPGHCATLQRHVYFMLQVMLRAKMFHSVFVALHSINGIVVCKLCLVWNRSSSMTSVFCYGHPRPRAPRPTSWRPCKRRRTDGTCRYASPQYYNYHYFWESTPR